MTVKINELIIRAKIDRKENAPIDNNTRNNNQVQDEHLNHADNIQSFNKVKRER